MQQHRILSGSESFLGLRNHTETNLSGTADGRRLMVEVGEGNCFVGATGTGSEPF
jgi:hypothetical protein